MVKDTTRSDPLGTGDALVSNLAIQNEPDAEMATPHPDSTEVVLAHEIDGPLDRVDSQRAAPLERAHDGVEERSERGALAAKVVVDAAGLA
jgi:hypothetical protein